VTDETRPKELQLLIDRVCNEFQSAWQSDRHVPLENIVAQLDAEYRPEVLSELVALEVELRQLAGELPTETEYARRFPELEGTMIRG
jgi:eukaryotic-like serine/threonine-protein kinase